MNEKWNRVVRASDNALLFTCKEDGYKQQAHHDVLYDLDLCVADFIKCIRSGMPWPKEFRDESWEQLHLEVRAGNQPRLFVGNMYIEAERAMAMIDDPDCIGEAHSVMIGLCHMVMAFVNVMWQGQAYVGIGDGCGGPGEYKICEEEKPTDDKSSQPRLQPEDNLL